MGSGTRLAHRLSLMTLLFLAIACRKEGQTSPSADTIKVPPDYEGPIDDEWPPSHPADMAIEIEASRLVLNQLTEGKARVQDGPLIEGDVPHLYVEEGRIGEFDYIEVILGQMKHPDDPMPLVVLIHGRGGKPHIPHGRYLSKHPLRVFIPRGPDSLKGGYNWLATWTNSGKTELLTRSLSARADQLMPAIEAFAELNPTVGKPVVAGFSQGGIMSFALATRFPHQFQAAVPVAGWLPPALVPQRLEPDVKYPTFHVLHGGADNVVPTQKGRETVAALRKIGLEVSYEEFPGVKHTVTEEMNRKARRKIAGALFSNPAVRALNAKIDIEDREAP